MSARPPQPAALTCACGRPALVCWAKRGIGPSYAHWAPDREGYWARNTRCTRCRSIRSQHGMTGAEYDAYLARGCAIPSCKRPAVAIDHDHFICGSRGRGRGGGHSCGKCRRGPLCHYHNTYILSVLDALRRGEFPEELAYIKAHVEFHPIEEAA